MPMPPKRPVFPTPIRPQHRTSPPRIYELLERECRYPVGVEAARGHHLFCAEATVGATSYCEKHNAVCNAGTKPIGMRQLARA